MFLFQTKTWVIFKVVFLTLYNVKLCEELDVNVVPVVLRMDDLGEKCIRFLL